MKQQPKSLRSARKDTAEIGIGTMIVFIAAVIVAAVAAAVLISTAGNLERQASQTGQETQDEVSANIFVRDLVGYINKSLDPSQMDSVNMTISLAPGANTVDLEEMSLRWQSGSDLVDLEYAGTSETDCNELSDGFCVIALTDDNQTPQVLQSGDRVNLHLQMGSDEALTTRTEVTLLLIPEVGSPITTGWTTPASYEDRTYVIIR